jgi:hypothetical protein
VGAAGRRAPAHGKETSVSEKFWLWAAAAGFAGVILIAVLYALAITRDCERRGGEMVRSFGLSGWACVQPIQR